MKVKGKCSEDTVHLQVKYLNNIVEADHGKLKRLINPVRGFKSMKTAYAIIKGFEVMRMFNKGQMNAWINEQGLTGEIRLIERQFSIYTAYLILSKICFNYCYFLQQSQKMGVGR